MATLRRSRSSGSNIPFLWEQLPGISKPIHDKTNMNFSPSKPTLPPPPCSTSATSPRPLTRRTNHVPLPPCPFAPTQELSSAKKVKKKKKKNKMNDHDDPFLAAFIECTKCSKKEVRERKSVKEKVMEMRGFSCKYDVGVRKDGMMIRVHDGNKFKGVKDE